MDWKFLKPKLGNVIITLTFLILPIFQERVPLSPAGPYVVEHYSPISMIIVYISLGDFYPLFQMIGFSLFAYVLVSVVLRLLNASIDYFKSTSANNSQR